MSGNTEADGRLVTASGSDLAGGLDDESRWWVREETARADGVRAPVRVREVGWPLGAAAVALLAGTGLRQLVPHPVALIAAIAGVVVVTGLAGPAWLRRVSRLHAAHPEYNLARVAGAEPGWVAEAAAYRQWLPRRVPPVPAQTLAAADRVLAGVTARGWRSAHLLIARAGPGSPLPMGVTRLLGDRVQIVLGDCIAEGPPEVAAATLAHEARHTTAVHAAIWNLLAMRARLIFLVGWALAWPAALWAALAVHAGLAALKWYMEVSADLAAARATGPEVMTKVFDVMTDLAAARRRAQRQALARTGMRALSWAAGPGHPPIRVRRAVITAWYRRRRQVSGGAGAAPVPGPGEGYQ